MANRITWAGSIHYNLYHLLEWELKIWWGWEGWLKTIWTLLSELRGGGGECLWWKIKLAMEIHTPARRDRITGSGLGSCLFWRLYYYSARMYQQILRKTINVIYWPLISIYRKRIKIWNLGQNRITHFGGIQCSTLSKK